MAMEGQKMVFILGIIGFVFLYIYEINQIIWNNKFLKLFFTGGLALVLSSTVMIVVDSKVDILLTGSSFWVGIFCFILFTYLLIYTLFFSIPFSESYVEQFNKREVYMKKMYSLSRHPGVLWFSGVYLSLMILIPNSNLTIFALVMVAMNVIYIILQDIWSFPRLFVDYEYYKKTTPFLIPTFKSILRTVKHYQGRI